jgi:predicted Zn-dependent protease
MTVTAREQFLELADWLVARAGEGEIVTAYLRGEDSDFVRLNRGRVRQAGHVSARELTVSLTRSRREARATLDLGGQPAEDRARLTAALARLRETLPYLPEDPFLGHPDGVESTDDDWPGQLPESGQALAGLMQASQGLDLVGIWAAGPVYRGFASSSGQRNWLARASFHLDWSYHRPGGVAVKAVYSGAEWEEAALRARVEEARAHLDRLALPPRAVPPGRYRAFLAPRALRELLEVLARGGFSLKAWQTRQTPLLRLIEGERRFAPAVALAEDTAALLAPRFTREGFIVPERVALVCDGAPATPLASVRSAREYGVPVNAAEEEPQALTLQAGDLPGEQVLEALGTGLYLGNLWYCNLSDRGECRVTGVTRYACFWVEGGRIVAPIAPMRFDESLYTILGDGLEGLTRERVTLAEDSTYEGRSTAAMRLPGALTARFTLTL